MIDGKAEIIRENFCDGLGDCLPACPADAISFEEREAPAYDEAAVFAAKEKKSSSQMPCGCPGTNVRRIDRADMDSEAFTAGMPLTSQLKQCCKKYLAI